jgi:hypothetical protein
MMEAVSTSESLVNFYQTTRRYNPEDSHLYTKIISLNNVNQLIFVMVTRCIFFKVGIKFLNIILQLGLYDIDLICLSHLSIADLGLY